MMQAMEGHLAAWAQRQIQALSTESDLFGHVRAVPGRLVLPPGPPLGPAEVAALVQVLSLRPQPENQDLGPRPVVYGHGLHLTAQVAFRLLGRTAAYAAGGDLVFTPAAAEVHRVDVAALTLLALLKEQPGPAADVPVTPLLAQEQGAQPAGAATAAHGARKVYLSWTAWKVGEVTVTPVSDDNLRQWDIAVTATCQFKLSPAALEGGRIMLIGSEVAVKNQKVKTVAASVYAPAESLPLGWFEGLGDSVVAELADHAVTTLGDLGRLGPARTGALAAELRTATPGEESLLAQLATMAVSRQIVLEDAPRYGHDPDAFALPARALLAPTMEEAEVLDRFIPSPEVHAQVTLLAVPVTTALKPARREQVTIGSLLIRGR
jgi:hypothetical protein